MDSSIAFGKCGSSSKKSIPLFDRAISPILELIVPLTFATKVAKIKLIISSFLQNYSIIGAKYSIKNTIRYKFINK